MKRRIVCFCEHSFDADVPDSVDLGKQPEVEQAILSGEFLSIRCPSCGKVLKPGNLSGWILKSGRSKSVHQQLRLSMIQQSPNPRVITSMMTRESRQDQDT